MTDTASNRPILLGTYLTALAAFLVLLPLVLALSGGRSGLVDTFAGFGIIAALAGAVLVGYALVR